MNVFRGLKTTRFIVIGAGLLAAAALACSAGSQGSTGGGDTATTEAPSGAAGSSPIDNLNACTILTQDDATGIFGAPADPGKDTYGTSIAMCQYNNADKTMGLAIQLIYDSGGALNLSDYKNAKDGSAQDVAGLGDGAYFNSLHHLVVAKGPWMVTVNGLVAGDPIPLEKLTPLAKTVLGRLP